MSEYDMLSDNSTLPGIFPAEPAPPDPSAGRCFLLGPTALVVQAIMGVMVISSLVIKRQMEKRKRRWRVWVLDVGKQLVGQAVIHALNLLISSVVAHAGQQNPCSLYFLNILIDTTIGTAIIWVSLKWYTSLFIRRFGPEGYTSGHYGNPPQWPFWVKQLQPYLLAAVTMKLVVLLPLTLPGISAGLIRFAQNILNVFNLDAQVIFVLAIFPTVMNVFQFCVVDQVIKAGKGTEAKDGHDSDYEDEEEGMRMYRPVPTDGEENGFALSSPRRRTSSLRGSKQSSRAGSTVTSPLLSPQDGRTGSTSNSTRIPAPLNMGDVWKSLSRSASELTLTSASGSRTRRSDAPSPDAGSVLFTEPGGITPTSAR